MRVDKILCPVDFSPPSREALHYAVELAAALGAHLTILHVYQPPTYVLPDGSVLLASAEALTDLVGHVDDALAEWKKDAESRGAEQVAAKAVQGTAWQEIVRTAEEEAFPMVVLGTHGRTGIRRLLLGSVAERVIRSCTRPVLTVHSAG